MEYIEFLGLPGSGKSTFARQIEQFFREQQRTACCKRAARKAVVQAIIRNNSGIFWQGIVSSLVGYRMSNLLWDKYRYDISLGFLREYPHLARCLIDAASRFESPSWLPEEAVSGACLLNWIFDSATHYHACDRYLGTEYTILQEEGFCQQAYYLLVAFRRSDTADDPLMRYLELIPKPRRLIVLTTPAEQCEAQMQQRPKGIYSSILSRMSVNHRLDLLTHRLTIHKRIAQHLEQQGVDVIHVGHTDYQASLDMLKEHLGRP